MALNGYVEVVKDCGRMDGDVALCVVCVILEVGVVVIA